MDRETILILEEALNASPENAVLRKQVAKGYFSLKEFEKAKAHLNIFLQNKKDAEAKLMLAKCYAELKQLSTAIIICEDLINEGKTPEVMSFYILQLVNDGQTALAIQQYTQYSSENNGWKDNELEKLLKVRQHAGDMDAMDDDDASHFMEKPEINFSEVGGMDDIKEEIRMKIIHPLTNPDLYKAFGKKAGGGILLYGPPGCGKTYLAKATAGEIQSKFISIGLEEILDMWMGNSEKNLHEKFETARRNAPCVLFFDEIDALGSKRNDLKQSAGRNLINQFLREMDGIDTDNSGLLILGATNSPWHMDSAFLRPGRFDRIIFVPPPDEQAREKILELQLKGKPCEKIDLKKVASKTDGLSGADLKMMVDLAVEEKLKDSMKSGKIEPVSTDLLLQVAKKMRSSVKDWSSTARNYALYSNASGMYDDILKFLKI